MDDDASKPPRGRRLLTALAVVAAVAAVPAGVALAGGSDEPSGIEGQAGPDAAGVQSTTPERGDRERGEGQGDGQRGGDREDCPEGRHGKPGSGDQDSGSQGSDFPGSGQPGTTEL